MIKLNKTQGFLVSFLFGGVIGGGIALLFAPKPGRQLRKDISRKTNEFIEDSRKKTSDIISGAKDLAESTLDSANEVLNTGVDKIAQKAGKIKEALKSGVNTNKDEVSSGNNQKGNDPVIAENTYQGRS